ncbi:MAG: GIY-YIG nuclease family protein [Solimonas sp.]
MRADERASSRGILQALTRRSPMTCSTPRPWFLYLLECADGSYYAGISPDPQARLKQHLNGSGAKYTRARKPLRIIAIEKHADRAAASVAEYRLKQLRKAAKRRWADAHAYRPAPDAATGTDRA